MYIIELKYQDDKYVENIKHRGVNHYSFMLTNNKEEALKFDNKIVCDIVRDYLRVFKNQCTDRMEV